MNGAAYRKVHVTSTDEAAEESAVHVQYHSDSTFSVYEIDEVNDKRTPLLENATVLVNPENEDELIIRTLD